jgi:hypothetical protein
LLAKSCVLLVFCVFLFKFVYHGGHRGDTAQALNQWWHPVTPSEALRTQTTTSTTHPHSNTLHSTTKMPPVPTPPLGSSTSSLNPQGQGVGSQPHIELFTRAEAETFAPTSRLLTLDTYLIGTQFAMLLLSELKNCLELENTGQLLTHLSGQTIREQIPCFPMTITLYG